MRIVNDVTELIGNMPLAGKWFGRRLCAQGNNPLAPPRRPPMRAGGGAHRGLQTIRRFMQARKKIAEWTSGLCGRSKTSCAASRRNASSAAS